MREDGLRARVARVYRGKAGVHRWFSRQPNHVRRTQATRPNQIWVGDVTYLAVGGTMSRLAALSTGKVHAAPISQIVVPVAEERGLKIMQLEPIPLIIDALWTSRKFAEENPQVVQNVLRGYIRAIAVLVKDREKSVEIMRKYMRSIDAKMVQGAYERYKEEVDRVPIPSEKAIKNTLEISHRVAPKLAGIDINRYLYFTPVQRLATEGFIDRLYK